MSISGDIDSIRTLGAVDCTTNPSLILRAASKPEYAALVADAIAWATPSESDREKRLDLATDRLAVNFGTALSRIVPGYVSTEVDARLSFDTEATVARAERIIALYAEAGIDKSRILIKIAATWEGVRAAEALARQGIACNLTLVFSLAQAAICADAGVFLISPFVGRITDWHAAHGRTTSTIEDDPGVRSVREIYGYYKAFGYPTVVMAASFRSAAQVLALSGCDRLTVSPQLLEQLKQEEGAVAPALGVGTAAPANARLALNEADFRWRLNEDAMATEKLAEGIRLFAHDTETLRARLWEAQA